MTVLVAERSATALTVRLGELLAHHTQIPDFLVPIVSQAVILEVVEDELTALDPQDMTLALDLSARTHPHGAAGGRRQPGSQQRLVHL